MDPDNLHDQLTKLHAELAAAPRVDPGSKQLLGELMEDIKRLMARSATSPGAQTAAATGAGDVSTPLPDRLEKIAVLFEVDHPTLAASSRRLVDLLGKVGI